MSQAFVSFVAMRLASCMNINGFRIKSFLVKLILSILKGFFITLQNIVI